MAAGLRCAASASPSRAALAARLPFPGWPLAAPVPAPPSAVSAGGDAASPGGTPDPDGPESPAVASDICDHILDDAGQFRRLEREPANPVVGDHVDEISPAEHQGQLTEVDLGNQHLVVAVQHLAKVGRER